MKVSAKDEYACSAVLELALNYGTELPVRVQDIAERQGIPMKFLFQIMQVLKKAEIVWSKRGTEGGYVLARHPRDITVGDVIQSVSGPFVQLAGIEEQGGRRSMRHFRSIWTDVDQAISAVLHSINFEDLARQARSETDGVMYHI